ncbi:MAG TPA: cytochrome c-type biogenesis protein CcmH [Bryobacteraceae bacterium]|nr:cytochrome c-type biogenesis protein CcmH [Bryobacteraceae bacterium]
MSRRAEARGLPSARVMGALSSATVLAIVLLTPAAAQMAGNNQNMRRVGARLACQCGCPDTVASCSMLGCGFSHPAKEKIAQMQAAGVPDAAIVEDFVKTYGQKIYRAEPNTFGWLVPYLALAFGTALVIWFVRRSRRSKPALVMDARLSRYNDEIEQELQNLDR